MRMEVHEQDPVEAYNREFQRKRWEKEQAAEARKMQWERKAFRIARFLAYPIAVFAFVLVADRYLPRDLYHEVGVMGWQERGHAKRKPPLHSYMQTKSFAFAAPHEAHLNYPYYEADKPVITISVTPIFKVPLHATFTLKDRVYSFPLRDFLPITIYWLLFISSMFTILRKEYSMLTYALCYVPIMLLAFALMTLYF